MKVSISEGLPWELNGLIQIKKAEQYLAQIKHPINVNYYYLLLSSIHYPIEPNR